MTARRHNPIPRDCGLTRADTTLGFLAAIARPLPYPEADRAGSLGTGHPATGHSDPVTVAKVGPGASHAEVIYYAV